MSTPLLLLPKLTGTVLFEPILLPSLVTGLTCFTRKLWEIRSQALHLDLLMPVLAMLLTTPPNPPESNFLHPAVLSIVARPLERALAHVQKLHPRRQDIDPLITSLKVRMQMPSTGLVQHSELEAWCTTPGGGLMAALKLMLRSMLVWSAIVNGNAPPPGYTHNLLLVGTSMLGAQKVLTVLLDEAVKLSAAGNSGSSTHLLVDILSTLVICPSPSHVPLSLKDALTMVYEDVSDVARKGNNLTELVGKLHRRVQAISVKPAKEAIIETINVPQDVSMELEGASSQGGIGLERREMDVMNSEVADMLTLDTMDAGRGRPDFLGEQGFSDDFFADL